MNADELRQMRDRISKLTPETQEEGVLKLNSSLMVFALFEIAALLAEIRDKRRMDVQVIEK